MQAIKSASFRALKKSAVTGRMSTAPFSRSLSSIEAPPGSFLPLDECTSRVMQALKTVPAMPQEATAGQLFAAELGFDSLMRRELVQKAAAEFCLEIPAADADKFFNGEAIAAYVAASPKAR